MPTVAQTQTSSFLPPPDDVYRLTIDQYDRMSQGGIIDADDRVELVDGILVPRRPRSPRHVAVRSLMAERLGILLPSGWHIHQVAPIRIPDFDEPEPDLAVVRGMARDYFTRHPGPADVGLICEVTENSLSRDRGAKASAYARARIPVFVILNFQEDCIEVHSPPADSGASYTRLLVHRPGEEMAIALDDALLGPISVSSLLFEVPSVHS